MIKIITNIEELSKKCVPCKFTHKDYLIQKQIETDLETTIKENINNCIGLAANQIGYDRRIIIAKIGKVFITMLNPHYIPVRTHGIKRSIEGCLSFPNRSNVSVRRYKKIKLTYQTISGKKEKINLIKLNAYIVQHEVDHLNGKLI